jgi:hypothetical protein
MENKEVEVKLEYKLVRDIVQENPKFCEILKRYFGEDCLNKPGFKIKTLEMACILIGIDPKRLLKEFEKINN